MLNRALNDSGYRTQPGHADKLIAIVQTGISPGQGITTPLATLSDAQRRLPGQYEAKVLIRDNLAEGMSPWR